MGGSGSASQTVANSVTKNAILIKNNIISSCTSFRDISIEGIKKDIATIRSPIGCFKPFLKPFECFLHCYLGCKKNKTKQNRCDEDRGSNYGTTHLQANAL